MGKERISSQEISEYTNINATQIRRDLSGFGKFGKRGVGYNIDALAGEVRKILRTQGQHNIALLGAGRLGQAIASSPIFADHGFNIAAAFDVDQEKVGKPIGKGRGPRLRESRRGHPREADHRRRPRSPGWGGAAGRRRRGRGRREDHLQLHGGAPERPVRRHGAHDVAGGRAPLRALLLPDVALGSTRREPRRCRADSRRARSAGLRFDRCRRRPTTSRPGP